MGSVFHALELEIENRLGEIPNAIKRFEEFAVEHDLRPAVRRSISLVLDELLNNTISYAYPDVGNHTISVRGELMLDRLVVTISDDGIPFNPFSRATPDTKLSIEDREIGGLGMHLVRNLMNEALYTRRADHNEVTLVMYLQAEDEN